MILMTLADGNIEDSEVDAMIGIYEKITQSNLDKSSLISEIDKLGKQKNNVTDYTGSLRGQLNDQGKEVIIKAAYLIATADGKFHESEQELLAQIAISLDLSTAHLKAVIEEINS